MNIPYLIGMGLLPAVVAFLFFRRYRRKRNCRKLSNRAISLISLGMWLVSTVSLPLGLIFLMAFLDWPIRLIDEAKLLIYPAATATAYYFSIWAGRFFDNRSAVSESAGSAAG